MTQLGKKQPTILDAGLMKKDFECFIKNKCPMCEEEFKNSWIHYKSKGNYCNDCSRAIFREVSPNMKKYNSKKRREQYLKNKARKIKSKK